MRSQSQLRNDKYIIICCLFRVSISLILCTAIRFLLNILELRYVGFDVSLSSFFSLVTSLTSTLFLRFSIVLPKTLLFISFKKSFSNEFLACFLFLVLKSMYYFSQGDWSNFSTLWIFLILRPRFKYSWRLR